MSLDPVIRKLETSNITRRRALGIYQIAGGLIGIVFVCLLLSSGIEVNLTALLVILIFFFYCLSIFCGLLLIRNKEIRLTLSLVNQLLQAISFDVNSIGFQYVAGVHFSVGFNLAESDNVNWRMGLSGLHASTGGEMQLEFVYINFVAILLIYYIVQLRKNIQKEIVLKDTAGIGDELSKDQQLRKQSPD